MCTYGFSFLGWSSCHLIWSHRPAQDISNATDVLMEYVGGPFQEKKRTFIQEADNLPEGVFSTDNR